MKPSHQCKVGLIVCQRLLYSNSSKFSAKWDQFTHLISPARGLFHLDLHNPILFKISFHEGFFHSFSQKFKLLLFIILFLVISKYYARGTTEVVVALGKKDLGNLKYMEISHNGLLEAWYLKAVKIKPMYTQKE